MADLGRVMIVDDEDVDRMLYERILKRSGLVRDVVSCPLATDALHYLENPASPAVDLILLDVNMPEMSGFDFLACAEPKVLGPRRIPVILMLTTPLAPAGRARAARHDCIQAFFAKPLRIDHLDRALDAVHQSTRLREAS